MKGITVAGERKDVVEALSAPDQPLDFRKKALSTYSGGHEAALRHCRKALLGKPRLIIVDEPTAGLDPAERNRFLNLLSAIGRGGHGDPLDAHRGRRAGALPAHGDHCVVANC